MTENNEEEEGEDLFGDNMYRYGQRSLASAAVG
jgi:hypothetical protein